MRYVIEEQYDGSFFCWVQKEENLYGEKYKALNYEGAMAWLRLVMGEYPDSFKLVG